VTLTLTRFVARLQVEGGEHLTNVPSPLLLASNHQSHLDTYVILAALPPALRYRTAPSIRDEVFDARQSWLRALHRLRYYFAVLHLNAFTLPQNLALRRALRHMACLASRQWSILIYPEGDRSASSALLPFREGVGFLARQLDLPVVPVRIDGTHRIFPRAPRTGIVRVRFGHPIHLPNCSRGVITRCIEKAIHDLA